MSTTATITTASGRVVEIRNIDPEFWKHSGPIEVGRYCSDQEEFLSNQRGTDQIVYHYTDLAGLHGIVRNGEIWASDVRMMNDRTEIAYALERMGAFLATELGDEINQQTLDAIFRPGRVWQFAACFSLARDQLSQWRAYGKEIAVSIAFHRKHLESAAIAAQGRLGECRYFGPSDFSKIKSELEPIAAALTAPKALNADGRLTDMTLQNQLIKRATEIAASIKHISFAEERELRLFVPIEALSNRVDFRSSHRRLIPFIKIELDGRRLGKHRERFANQLGMMEVIVWPNDADDQILDAIDMLLSGVGGVLIRRSASPYRT